MDFDELLSGYLGEFGFYQKRVYFLVCIPAIYCALNSFAWTFTGAEVPHRCKLSPSDIDFHSPPSNLSLVGSCGRLNSEGLVESCVEGYVWDNSERGSTALQDWELVCDRGWLQALVQSLYYLGIFCGSLSVSYAADRFGRKPVMIGSCFFLSAISTACAACPGVSSFVVARFLQGFFEAGVWQIAFVLGIELVGPKRRLLAGLIIEYCFSLGVLLLGLIAWAFRGRWEYLQIAVSVPGFLFVGYYWMVPESPRWLLCKGKKELAVNVIRKAAEVNKVLIPEDVLDSLKAKEEVLDGEESNNHHSYADLLRTPNMRRKTLIVCYCWAIVSLVYYGISLNPSALAGDFYLSFVLSSLTELAGITCLMFTLNRLGRRPIQTAGFAVSGIALILILVVPEGMGWLTLSLVLLAKISVVSAFCTIYIYTSEIFPTVVRSIAIGLASTCARIGGIASPFASLYMKEEENKIVLLGVFGTSSILAALLSLLLPETTHKRLPETLEDGENFSSDVFYCGWSSRDSIDKKRSGQALVSCPSAQDNQEL